MRAFTPASMSMSSPPRAPSPSRLPRDMLLAAFALAIVASAILVPLAPPFSMGLALLGGFVLCRVTTLHVLRALLVVSTTIVMLVLGAFDHERNLSVRRTASPDATIITWLVTVDGSLHLFVEPLPLRALVGDASGAVAALDRSVESARVVWAKDSSTFVVVGTPKTKSLWARGRLAWDDEHVLGQWDPQTPWRWEPLPPWSARAPQWLDDIARTAYVEPMVLASTMEGAAKIYLSPSITPTPTPTPMPTPSAANALLARGASVTLFPFTNVDAVRVVPFEGRAKALVLGRPRWHLLWAEGRLKNGEHVLAMQDAATYEWSVLDAWATTTPSWLRALHADDTDALEFAVPREEKARLCNCTP